MKRSELYGLHQNLSEASKTAKGIKLSYAIVKSIRHVENEIKDLEELRKPGEAFQEFERIRIELCKEHSNKEANGQPKIITLPNGAREYDIIDRPSFEKAIEELKAAHKPAIAEQDQKLKDFQKFIDEDVEPRLHKIKFSVVQAEQEDLRKKGTDCEDLLDADKLNKLWDLIDDDIEAVPASSEKGGDEAKPDLKMMK